jgi:Cu-processing system ATP-binding protein
VKELRLEHVSVRFGKVHALSDVSIGVRAGEALMLVGPNGAGKTTFMRVLLGLVRPESGTLTVDGAARSADNDLKRRIGYLPEAVAFSENLTGLQVLKFFARARKVSNKRVDEVLERVGLAHAARRRVRGYSRGMRQRLGLAIAIMPDPELLILDEPTGGLDQEGLSVLWSVMGEWRARDRMILLATHDIALLERRVDRMCLFRAGTVLADDKPEQLRQTAGLPQRVTMELNEQANGQVSGLVR